MRVVADNFYATSAESFSFISNPSSVIFAFVRFIYVAHIVMISIVTFNHFDSHSSILPLVFLLKNIILYYIIFYITYIILDKKCR